MSLFLLRLKLKYLPILKLGEIMAKNKVEIVNLDTSKLKVLPS